MDNKLKDISKKEIVKKGISFGTGLAIVISFTTYRSIMWAILHGLCSWLYVIYYCTTQLWK